MSLSEKHQLEDCFIKTNVFNNTEVFPIQSPTAKGSLHTIAINNRKNAKTL